VGGDGRKGPTSKGTGGSEAIGEGTEREREGIPPHSQGEYCRINTASGPRYWVEKGWTNARK